MVRFSLRAFVAVTVLSLGSACHGDVLTVSDSINNEFIELTTQSGGAPGQNSPTSFSWDETFTQNFSVAQFDSSIGVLESIQISFNATVVWGIESVYSGEFVDPPFTTSFTGQLTLSPPATAPLVEAGTGGGSNIAEPGFPGFPQYSAFGSSALSSSIVSVPAFQHGIYVGNGTVTLPMNLQFTAAATLDRGSIEFTPVPEVSVTAYVAYTYTPVPEPSCFGLVIAVVGLLPLVRRR